MSTVSEAMREPEPDIVLKTLTPTTQHEARVKKTENIEQETLDEVPYSDGMKVISGKWVDTEKAPGVAKAR